MKKYKIQNRSLKNSHSCVPLRDAEAMLAEHRQLRLVCLFCLTIKEKRAGLVQKKQTGGPFQSRDMHFVRGGMHRE